MNYFAKTLEPSARAIAAQKRGLHKNHPIVDRVWPSYVGMAKAAVIAFLEDCGQQSNGVTDRDPLWLAKKIPGRTVAPGSPAALPLTSCALPTDIHDPAQGIEAGTAKTAGLGPQDESPVLAEDAPNGL